MIKPSIISNLFQQNNFSAVLELVEKYGFSNIKNVDGYNSLHLAAEQANFSMISQLINNGADIYLPNKYGELPFHYSSNKQVIENFLELGININTKDNFGTTLLHTICRNGNLNIFQFLLSNNADLNITDNFGNTPFHLACMCNSYDIINLLIPKNIDIINSLISKNVDINIKNHDGNTPLHLACSWEGLEAIELLIQNNCDLNIANNEGDTPLHLACKYDHNIIVQLFLTHNANSNMQNNNNLTALDIALQSNYYDSAHSIISYQNYAEINQAIPFLENSQSNKKPKL